ncbi:TonB-dependent siderophore receptor [filamentous cyanobacterium CCT1]|nr:TonB-dependent siderophore receptor [filamentous cyanobacterium CCT1]PSN76117.1 TonB-dependent siderophore receptor [filamentous cyanobacterium CCP4]
MGVRLQGLVLLAGWLALVPMAAQAETALSLQDIPQTNSQAADLDLAQGVTQITGVRVEPEGEGLRLVLDADGPLGEPMTSVVGNALVAEIPNAVLALPEGESFEQFGPAEGIALVSVTSLEGNRVRVSITGNDGPPAVTVNAGATGLVLGIAPGVGLASTDDEAIRIGVTGEGDEGYDPSSASTATGIDTPLRDVPQSIQVIPEAVIEDRNALELQDALETATGVVSRGGRGTSVFGPGFLIRGFPTEESVFRDGIETFSLAPLDTNDVERIEILKGPASVLFGQGDPGGIINLVSERPLSEPRYEVSATVGNYSTYRGDLDLTGPLPDDDSARYRLNLTYSNFGSFRDFVDGERVLVSPTLSVDVGPNTALDIYGQYAYNRETIDEGIPFTAAGPVDVPRSRFIGEDFGEFSQNQFSFGYRLNHDFNESLELRHAFQYLEYSPRRYAPLYGSFDETTGLVDRIEYFAGGRYQRFFTNAEVVGRFSTGSVQHQVLAGVEYRNTLEQPEFQFSNDYTSINVFNPVYTGLPFAIEPEFFRDDTINTVGVYVQDQIDILPNLIALAGVRYDFVNQFRTTQEIGAEREEFFQSNSAFSPRFGIVYQPIEPISLYASYTESFEPSFGASRNADGSIFDPETGRQYEVGIKADLTDTLSLNFAAFDIRKRNVETQDPNDPLLSVQTGEVTSRGLELNLSGEILPGWNLVAGYTLLDAFVSEDTTDIEGNQLANVPNHQFALWSTYEIQEGSLEGLGFGLGLFYLSDRPGTLENSFTLPSYFRTDAAVFYQRNNWRAQLNFENIFDVEYFTSSDEFQFASPGAPFTVTAKVAVEF